MNIEKEIDQLNKNTSDIKNLHETVTCGFTFVDFFIVLVIISAFTLVGFVGVENYNQAYPKGYDGTYCKAGYVFIDEDTLHGNSDQQLRNENGGGVPCNQEK